MEFFNLISRRTRSTDDDDDDIKIIKIYFRKVRWISKTRRRGGFKLKKDKSIRNPNNNRSIYTTEED